MSLQEEHVMNHPSGVAFSPSASPSARRRSSNFCRGLASLYAAPTLRHHSLQSQLLGRPGFVRRLEQQPVLNGHHGCVNTVAWDETGEYLVSGSDDLYLNIYRPLDPRPLVHRIRSGHRHNIFSAKFLTNTQASKIVSCAADCITRLTDVHRFVAKSANDDWSPYPGYNCHTEMTYEVMPDAVDSHIFYDCADDGRIHRYDIRIRTSCDCEEHEICDRHAFININSNYPSSRRSIFSSYSPFRLGRRTMLGVTAITQRPENPIYIAAACSDDTVRIYDIRMVGSSNHRTAQVYSYSPFVPPGYVVGSDGELKSGANTERSHLSTKITSLKYDPCGSGQLLVSYSRGDCYLIQPSSMGTKDEDGRRRASLTIETLEKSLAHEDKNGKRRRSSDSPEGDGDAVKPKTTPSTQALEHSKHVNTRKRSARSDKAGPSTSKGKGKDKSEKKGVNDVEMEVDEASGTSSQVDKGKEKGNLNQPEGRVTRARQRRLAANQGTSNETKDTAKVECTTDEEMNASTTMDPEVKVEEEEEEEDDDDDDDESVAAQTEGPFEIRLSDLARFRGWGEAVSEDSLDRGSEDEDEEEDEEEDEDPDGTMLSRKAIREDADYWAKRSYRTSRKDTVQIYSGHRNARTMIKEANFYGPNSEFVMSGSDDGRIIFWDKMTGKIENAIRGDKQVVNCLQPHPLSKMLLTASGIDNTIKIFMPTSSTQTDLSKVRGIRRPVSKEGERRIVYGAAPVPFDMDSTRDENHDMDSPSSLPSAPTHPENELDIEHAFDTFHRDSDDGSDNLFGSDDDDDDDDDDDLDDSTSRFLGNLPARYVLQFIAQLAHATHRAREAQAAQDDDDDDDDDDDEEVVVGQDNDEEDNDDFMALG